MLFQLHACQRRSCRWPSTLPRRRYIRCQCSNPKFWTEALTLGSRAPPLNAVLVQTPHHEHRLHSGRFSSEAASEVSLWLVAISLGGHGRRLALVLSAPQQIQRIITRANPLLDLESRQRLRQ